MVDGFAARLAAYFTFTTKGLRHFLVTGGSAFAAEAVIASGFVPLEHRGQQPSLDAHLSALVHGTRNVRKNRPH